MVNKPKRQGTAWEGQVRDRLHTVGIEAKRLAEGGSKDEGDIEFWLNGEHWIVESKRRQNYQGHKGLAAAKRKAYDYADADRVAVAWKRTILKEGNVKRSADGEPVIVILDWRHIHAPAYTLGRGLEGREGRIRGADGCGSSACGCSALAASP